jgi:hypothetical protein
MFDTHLAAVGLMPGLSQESLEAEDELAFELTCREMADG